MGFLSFCRFYLVRVYAEHPIRLVVCAVSLVACVLTLCGITVVREQALLTAREHARLSGLPPTIVTDVHPESSAVSLPPFSAAALVKHVNDIADDMHVPVDEVGYSLDNAEKLPYLRYRITLTTKAGYVEIRKLLAGLSSEMPNVTLDGIHCTRPDAGTAALGCELALSAFFGKAGHG